jgi:hypothetical protein
MITKLKCKIMVLFLDYGPIALFQDLSYFVFCQFTSKYYVFSIDI